MHIPCHGCLTCLVYLLGQMVNLYHKLQWKNSPVMGWGALSTQSNIKMSKERPIHQPTHKTIYPPIGGESTHISNLQTELKYLDSFNCYNILTDLGGYPLGGRWGGWMGCGWVWVYEVPHANTHVHACTHMHMHVKHDKHGCLHGGGYLQLLNMQ